MPAPTNPTPRAPRVEKVETVATFIIYGCNIQAPAGESDDQFVCTVLARRFYGGRRIVGFSSGPYFSSSDRSIFTTAAAAAAANRANARDYITFTAIFSHGRVTVVAPFNRVSDAARDSLLAFTDIGGANRGLIPRESRGKIPLDAESRERVEIGEGRG